MMTGVIRSDLEEFTIQSVNQWMLRFVYEIRREPDYKHKLQHLCRVVSLP